MLWWTRFSPGGKDPPPIAAIASSDGVGYTVAVGRDGQTAIRAVAVAAFALLLLGCDPLRVSAAPQDEPASHPTAAVASGPPPKARAETTFADTRRRLLEAAGPWTGARARVWTEPSPVAVDATYRVRFEARCDCAALLFSVDGSSDEIALLYPNPYERERRLSPGEVIEIPSSDGYALRAVGGAGLDVLKLFVTRGEFAFATPSVGSWGATPETPEAVTQLAEFLASLEGEDWAEAATPLPIVR